MKPTLVVDSREKKPYNFPGIENVIQKELNVGDYSYEGYEDVFAVERKTLDDLATSLGTERERFEAEIQRAQSLQEFDVVIESPASSVYDYQGQKSCPSYFSQIYPNSIIGTVESWPERYDILNFTWCDNRNAAKEQTLRYLDKWYVNYRYMF